MNAPFPSSKTSLYSCWIGIYKVSGLVGISTLLHLPVSSPEYTIPAMVETGESVTVLWCPGMCRVVKLIRLSWWIWRELSGSVFPWLLEHSRELLFRSGSTIVMSSDHTSPSPFEKFLQCLNDLKGCLNHSYVNMNTAFHRQKGYFNHCEDNSD